MLESKFTRIQMEKNGTRGGVYSIFMALCVALIGALVCSLFLFMANKKIMAAMDENVLSMVGISIVSMVLGYFFLVFLETDKRRRNRRKQANMYRKQMESVHNNIQDLQMQYKQFDEERE